MSNLSKNFETRLIVTWSANDEYRRAADNIKLTADRLKVYLYTIGDNFITHVHMCMKYTFHQHV